MRLDGFTLAMDETLRDLGYTFRVLWTSITDQQDYVQYFSTKEAATTVCQYLRDSNNCASVQWYENTQWYEDYTV